MEREPILSVIPPANVSQPLLALANSIEDDNEDKDGGIGLRTLSRIPAAAITDNKDIGELSSIQPAVAFPASSSIQTDLIEGAAEDDPEIPIDYQPLADDDENASLYLFLESLGITRQHIDNAKVPKAALLKLFQQEFSCFSWLKWSSLDHAIEKNLQWPLLSPTDVGSETPQTCDYRVRPHERTILLKTTWGLIKAYAVRGFVQGVEMGLLESVHYFIYAMLPYRLGELAKTGQSDFEEFQSIFSGSSQKGIDSLVRSLAGLEPQWLKLLLAVPFILGVMQGIVKMRGARRVRVEEIKKISNHIHKHLVQPGGLWQNVFLEKIPLLSTILSLSNQVQKLEQWVRWDGRLDSQSRKQAFDIIHRVTWEGNKITQLNALESLAKIAHGIGLKDLPRLQRAGYSPEELTGLFYIKAIALTDLQSLSQSKFIEEKRSKKWAITKKLASVPRRLYATYLLWWLGQSTSWWKQRLLFSVFKAVKLGLEILFLQKIVASILEAINCPDKPGFQFGNGYQDWASDYTAECFKARVNLFRTINTNESVAAFVAEIPQYHLTELTVLDLNSKYLNSTEALQIIQAVVQQGALLQTLSLNDNQISVLSEGVFSGLSQLTTLDLDGNQISVLSEGVFSRLSQLNYLNLNNNQISILGEELFSGLSQLTYLDLSSNQISVLSEGMFSGLSQLTYLGLLINQISVLSKGVFSGLNQLTILDLQNNPISILSEGAFNGLSQLISLRLFNSQISVLSEGVFSGLSQLTTLELSYNQISVLSEGVFSGLSQLTSLYLDSNQINVLSEGVFSGLNKLTTLYLDSNQIRSLAEGVFSELNQLQTLGLSINHLNTSTFVSILSSLPMTLTQLNIASNQISALPQNFSSWLPIGLQSLSVGGNSFIPSILTREFMQYFPFRLTRLSLFSSSGSSITNITENSFSDFSALTNLDLSHNQISALSDGVFSGLSQLTYLSLNSNQINVLSKNVFNELGQLISLDLSYNKINVLRQGAFNRLSQLFLLSLSNNQINVLSKDVFNELSQLTYLYLHYNQISILSEGTFSGLSQLHYLSLYNNQISVLNECVFSGLSQLTYLDLNGNQISVLSGKMFSGLNQLTYLEFYSNQISVLNEGVFSELSQLHSLSLYDNQISVLKKGIFGGLSQLTSLNLDSNQINVLSEGVFGELSQLTSLGLGSNQINVLAEGVFSGLSYLTYLGLYSNQLSVLSKGVFGELSHLINLYLNNNKLNDTAIQNLTQNFPYQLNILDVSDNQIGNDGALALAKVLPCTNLTTIDFIGNPAKDTTLALAAQQKALQKVCDDQRCHTNLPATESCGVNIDSPTTGQIIWELFGNVNEVDETQSDFSDYADWSYPAETPSFQSALALPSTTSEPSSLLLTTKTAGAIILGVAGLGVLLYKNSIWMQALINTGSNLFQRCWRDRKTQEAKSIHPTCSSDRRYALFSLSNSSEKQVSTVTRTTNMTPY